MLAHLPPVWHKFEINTTTPFPFKERKTVDAKDLIRVIHEVAHIQCQETSDVLADEAMPGARLRDKYPTRITIEVEAPPKPKRTGRGETDFETPSSDFIKWRAKFERDLNFALNDHMAIVVFSDGSQAPAKRRNRGRAKVQTGSAFICRW